MEMHQAVGVQSEKEHHPGLLSVMATQEVAHHSLASHSVCLSMSFRLPLAFKFNPSQNRRNSSCTRKHPLSSCVPIQSCVVQSLLYVNVPVTYVTIKLEGAHGRDPAGSNWFFTTSCTQFTDQSYQKKLSEICPPVRTRTVYNVTYQASSRRAIIHFGFCMAQEIDKIKTKSITIYYMSPPHYTLDSTPDSVGPCT